MMQVYNSFLKLIESLVDKVETLEKDNKRLVKDLFNMHSKGEIAIDKIFKITMFLSNEKDSYKDDAYGLASRIQAIIDS
jgi:hypothetical protein